MFWRVGVGVGVTVLLGSVQGWDDVRSVVVLVLNQLTILIRFFKSPSPRLDVSSPFLTASNCTTTRWHRACTSPVVTGCGGCIFFFYVCVFGELFDSAILKNSFYFILFYLILTLRVAFQLCRSSS